MAHPNQVVAPQQAARLKKFKHVQNIPVKSWGTGLIV
jgi:hypothetical protein